MRRGELEYYLMHPEIRKMKPDIKEGLIGELKKAFSDLRVNSWHLFYMLSAIPNHDLFISYIASRNLFKNVIYLIQPYIPTLFNTLCELSLKPITKESGILYITNANTYVYLSNLYFLTHLWVKNDFLCPVDSVSGIKWALPLDSLNDKEFDFLIMKDSNELIDLNDYADQKKLGLWLETVKQKQLIPNSNAPEKLNIFNIEYAQVTPLEQMLSGDDKMGFVLETLFISCPKLFNYVKFRNLERVLELLPLLYDPGNYKRFAKLVNENPKILHELYSDPIGKKFLLNHFNNESSDDRIFFGKLIKDCFLILTLRKELEVMKMNKLFLKELQSWLALHFTLREYISSSTWNENIQEPDSLERSGFLSFFVTLYGIISNPIKPAILFYFENVLKNNAFLGSLPPTAALSPKVLYANCASTCGNLKFGFFSQAIAVGGAAAGELAIYMRPEEADLAEGILKVTSELSYLSMLLFSVANRFSEEKSSILGIILTLLLLYPVIDRLWSYLSSEQQLDTELDQIEDEQKPARLLARRH